MKIVVLDGYTVAQTDLSWDSLKDMADVDVYDRTAPDDVVERCKGAEMVLTNKVVLDASVLKLLPRLMYIGVLATGYNVVDLEVANSQNITVTNIPAYSTRSVAQLVFAHLLNIVNRVDYYADANRKGRWCDCEDFCYLDHKLVELAGKRFGIVGLGNIGMEVACIASAFGMDVVAYTSKRGDLPYGIKSVSLDELFATSDVVSLHCPLTDDTRHLVNAQRLNVMKSSAIIINTARGAVIDNKALAEMLNKDCIAGAGIDVYEYEPPLQSNHPLLSAKNVVLLPHVAFATEESFSMRVDIILRNLDEYLAR